MTGSSVSFNDIEARSLQAIGYVIDVLEGGGRLVTDSGGPTRWGVSKKAYPGLDIANLARETAEDIYRRDYWNKIKGDLLPPPLALIVFSAAVNMGCRRAIELLQEALNVDSDGIMGPQTLIAAQGYRPEYELRARFNEAWLRSYFDLSRRKPIYMSWLYGWAMRVFRTADEAGRWAERLADVPRIPASGREA